MANIQHRKMNSLVLLAKCFIILTIILNTARYGECLHCFQCHNISEGVDCNVITKCNSGESCFIERSGSVNNTKSSLGCVKTQDCPAEHDFTIVGRSVQSQCKKCCSVDGCNKKYCERVHPATLKTTLGTCIDSPSENCTRWASLINICATPHRAKDICRKYCGLCDMVDGSWGDWHDWSSCSTTCGLGIESRIRRCNYPAPAHGGYDCPGNGTEQRSCFSRPCPVHGGWNSWQGWEQCSKSCGNGIKKRHRSCDNPPPSVYGHFCLGDPVDFSLCTGNDCGNHTTLSTPVPTTPQCDDVLNDCDIANKTFGICNNFETAKKSCAEFCGLCGIVDGMWAIWSPWTPCSTSCGQGSATRTRTCSNPLPQNGGKSCAGNNSETKNCTLRTCPVHGGWGSWAHWSPCSSTCGQGMTRRTRVCDNPRPQMLGNYCFGDSTEYGMCLVKPCPVDGGWTHWTHWYSCSATCGTGQATRQRFCSSPTPANGGSVCPGSRTENKTCNVAICPGVKPAFTVTIPTAGSRYGTLRFTNAITNVGGHYSTSTGIFTCKFPGMYFFALHILKTSGSPPTHCYIRKNQSNLLEVHSLPASSTNYDTSSNAVVIHLNRGDQVDVGGCSNIDGIYKGRSGMTSFFGFLLTAD